jgi:hypothetical protein
VGILELRRTATRVTLGAICLSSSNHFPPMLYSPDMKPVAVPPGRAKLSAKPAPTGSAAYVNTIGTVGVTCNNGPTSHRKERLLVACAHCGGRRSCDAGRNRLSGARIHCSVGDFHDRWVPRSQSGRLCAGNPNETIINQTEPPRIYRSNAPTAYHATIAMMTFVTKTAKTSRNCQPHLSGDTAGSAAAPAAKPRNRRRGC